MQRILICFSLFIHITASAQFNVDSLENQLVVSPVRDTNRAIVLYRLCWAYRHNNPGKSEKYGHEALKLSMELNFQKGIGASYNNLGSMYEQSGDDVKALKYFTLALDAKRKTGDKKSLASTLNNIGIIYKKQEHFDRALQYYREAAAINKESGNKAFLSVNYYNMANCFKGLHIPDSAFYYFDRSLQISYSIGDKKGPIDVLSSMGSYYTDQQKFDKALLYIDSAGRVTTRTGSPYDDSYFQNKGIVLLALNNLDSAEWYLVKVWDMKKNGTDWTAKYEVSEQLSILHNKRYRATGDPKMLEKSIAYMRMAYDWRDSLMNYQRMNTIFDLVTEDLVKQKNAEIEAVQREKQLTDLKADNERQSKNFIIVIAGAAVIVLLVIWQRYRKNKILNTILAEQNVQIETKNREIIDSITYAKRLQEAILPPQGYLKQFFSQSFILYLPKDIVAGDFYWVTTAGDRIYIAAADCTGHGVPGAMVSVVCANALERSVNEFGLRDTAAILAKTRSLVVQTFEKSAEMVNDGMDISLLSLSLADTTKNAQWSGANNPIWIVRDGELIEIKGDKQPVGTFETQDDFTSHNIEFKSGDWIYLLTDGYADQFGGPKGKKYKYSTLKEQLIAISNLNADQQAEELATTLNNWKGNYFQVDDVCVVGIRL